MKSSGIRDLEPCAKNNNSSCKPKFESGSRKRTRSREEKSSRRRRSVSSDDGHKRKKRKEITQEEIEDYMARKAQKKAMRIARKLKTPTVSGYSNDSNPFGDTNLNEKSCLNKGYMKDDVHLFVRKPVRRSPIINRGMA